MVSVQKASVKTTPILQAQNVTFGYGHQPLLYDVSLAIQPGEVVGLLGPNGSGKTTLLRLLSGFLRPRQGRVLLEGRELQQWGRRGVAQRIAVVPQELHIPFAFTVEQMVGLGRTPFIRTFFGTQSHHDRHIVQEALAVADIAPLGQRIFNELSGGERQRVTIAMALAQQPTVLLLDEPTSHLDIKYQIETLELIQRLKWERSMTIVAAMHDLNLAARYFPRLLLFQRGIVADAGPAEVLEPDMLRRVYGVSVQVGILRGSAHLSVVPPGSEGGENVQERSMQPPVHIIAGGGSGEVLMRALADEQIAFTIGALNIGDSDHTLALRLAYEVITEQPYAPISPDVLERVRVGLERAAVLIICPVPIGPGNVAMLREAVVAAQRGLPVILFSAFEHHATAGASKVGQSPGEREILSELAMRDYTGGEALKLLEILLQTGTIVVQSVTEILTQIKKLQSLHPSVSP